ncbi:hypothetical protein CFY87_05890 [Actinobacillus seminis]|uniref:Protein of uncharacterized function (DUF2570) n=1 Tax=Actinobacillus seminis TaxID=722 RepID=A0A263HE90_9PAST|nr:DUF2570 family protein [Actinobacillus seminis]OZN24866.1 hypothetical protein CFY87_05890 [Actinobacillus seminis]SUU36715.1 Protein of uncharacterised function (DUF2570) [Actinobacillus seminis]
MLRSKLWTVVFFVILGLCTGLWYQSQKINSLKAENQAQAQTIKQNEQVISQMHIQMVQEREAMQKQRALEQLERGKAGEDVKIIYKTIKDNRCFDTRLPDDVIKRLQQSN